MELKHKKVVVIGGSSGIGLAIAKAAAAARAEVVISSRSPRKLEEALKSISQNVMVYPMDLTQEDSVSNFFQREGALDHLVISGSSVKMAGFHEMAIADAMTSMDSKFWRAYRAIKAANINSGGSVTLFSGTLSRKPSTGTTIISAINAAIEGLGRALAVALAPIRVNVICPGLVDTPIFADLPEGDREAMFQNAAENLPVGRIGQPEDIAAMTMQLMSNPYVTGTMIDIDGGSLVL